MQGGRILVFAWLVLSACVCNAQVTATAETRYQLTGIDGYQIVEDAVFAPKDSKPRLVPVGWLTVDSEAAIVRVKAEDQQRRRLAVKQFTASQFAILGSGKIWIDVTAVDFEKQIFEQESFTIDVGEAPEPDPDNPDPPTPPGPSPDVPEDQFGNLGQRIDAAADESNLQHDRRLAVAEAYQTVVEDMQAFRILRSQDAREKIDSLLSAIDRGPEWQATMQVVSADAASRTGLSWEQLIAWYAAAATGYRGGAAATSAATSVLWHRVQDSLPHSGIVVLVRLGDESMALARWSERGWTTPNNERLPSEPTHWVWIGESH